MPLPEPAGEKSQRWFAVAPRTGRLGEGWAVNRYCCSLGRGVGGYRGSDEGGWQKVGLPRRRGFMEAGLPQAMEQ